MTPADVGSDRTYATVASQTSSQFCLTCHDGTAPAGVTVPSGVYNVGADWTGAAGGAFHSGVQSSGNGGGLKAPYARGMEVACSACHTSHGGTNAYHVPSTVNGTAGITYTVATSAQAQALCASCHSGTVHDWHQACSDCHVTTTGRFGHGGDCDDAGRGLGLHGVSRTRQVVAALGERSGIHRCQRCHCGAAVLPPHVLDAGRGARASSALHIVIGTRFVERPASASDSATRRASCFRFGRTASRWHCGCIGLWKV